MLTDFIGLHTANPPDRLSLSRKKMHYTKSLACLLLAGSVSSAAFANDQLNLVGAWVGVANVAVLGVNPHHGTTNAE